MSKIIKKSQKFFVSLSGTFVSLSGTFVSLSGTFVSLSGTFVSLSATKATKKFAAMFDYFSSPFGLRQEYCSASLKPLKIEPLCPADFALHINISATQRFHAVNVRRALA